MYHESYHEKKSDMENKGTQEEDPSRIVDRTGERSGKKKVQVKGNRIGVIEIFEKNLNQTFSTPSSCPFIYFSDLTCNS